MLSAPPTGRYMQRTIVGSSLGFNHILKPVVQRHPGKCHVSFGASAVKAGLFEEE